MENISKSELERAIGLYSNTPEDKYQLFDTLIKEWFAGNVSLPDDFIRQTIESCKRAKRYERAGEIAERANLKDEAMKLYGQALREYERKAQFGKARYLALRLGWGRQAKIYRIQEMRFKGAPQQDVEDSLNRLVNSQSFDSYANTGSLVRIASLAKSMGQTGMAETLYQRVMKLYEQRQQYVGAAKTARDLGLEDKAKEFYKKAIEQFRQRNYSPDFIVKIYREAGLEEEANAEIEKTIDSFVTENHYASAATFCDKVGLHDKARQLRKQAVGYLEGKGLTKLAVKMAEKAGMQSKARSLWREKIKETEAQGNYLQAAKMAEQGGMAGKARSLRMYVVKGKMEKGNLKSALKLASRFNLADIAVRLQEQIIAKRMSSNPMDAMILALEWGHNSRAQKVYSSHYKRINKKLMLYGVPDEEYSTSRLVELVHKNRVRLNPPKSWRNFNIKIKNTLFSHLQPFF